MVVYKNTQFIKCNIYICIFARITLVIYFLNFRIGAYI